MHAVVAGGAARAASEHLFLMNKAVLDTIAIFYSIIQIKWREILLR